MELIIGFVVIVAIGVIIKLVFDATWAYGYQTKVTPHTDEWGCDLCSNPESKRMSTHWDQLSAEAFAMPTGEDAKKATVATPVAPKPKRARKKTSPEKVEKAVPAAKPAAKPARRSTKRA